MTKNIKEYTKDLFSAYVHSGSRAFSLSGLPIPWHPSRLWSMLFSRANFGGAVMESRTGEIRTLASWVHLRSLLGTTCLNYCAIQEVRYSWEWVVWWCFFNHGLFNRDWTTCSLPIPDLAVSAVRMCLRLVRALVRTLPPLSSFLMGTATLCIVKRCLLRLRIWKQGR